MREKIKATGSIFIILLLLPYVAVMLVGGQTGKHAYGQESAKEEEASGTEELEEWVLEILPAQMPVTYEKEALKAQAVLIRSNLAYHLQQEQISPQKLDAKKLEEWELPHYSILELEEIWGEALFEEYYGKIIQAVQETRGQVLRWEGRYVDLPYHAVSAGRTRDGSLLGDAYPYLQVAECPGDLEAENFIQLVQLDLSQTPEITAVDDSGYVTEIRLGESLMAGEEFRIRENLPSSCFTLQQQEGAWLAVTKGLGHGFGLSMHQAQLKACQGKTYLEILEYFYEGMECISFS
ncbi:MAG: hypothetical protein HFI33_04460 [Lachnospiraceae bacterium]|nr:hypothetical protein [Lachnospiraceae bacterium]